MRADFAGSRYERRGDWLSGCPRSFIAVQDGCEKLSEIYVEGGRRRGVDYSGGRRALSWAKEAGFDVIHVDAYHPHYLTGEHKGFWNWTLRAAAEGLISEGTLTADRLEELVAGMTEADASPDTVVAHCRMHQLIARKRTTTP